MPFGGTSRISMTDMDLNTRLIAPSHVLSRHVGEEIVLLDLKSGIYFGLDGVGKLIWEFVSEGNSLDEIVARIVAEYEVAEATARKDVVDFAGNLVERGLLLEYLD